MSRIMIDLDGPVVDFGTGMIPCLQEQGVATDPDDYYFGAGQAGFRERMRNAIRLQNVFGRCKPHIGAINGLWELYERSNDLYIVSARIYGKDTEAWSYHQTMEWLQKYEAPPAEIILVEHGSNKADICREFGLSLAIEDDLRNYNDLAMSYTTACYLMDRPWNQTPERPDINKLFRVFSWHQFVEEATR